MNTEHVVRILRLADNDLLYLESRYYNLKSEVKSLEAKKGGLIRTIQEYENQLGLLGKSFDNYCQLCLEEEIKLTHLQRQRSTLKVDLCPPASESCATIMSVPFLPLWRWLGL